MLECSSMRLPNSKVSTILVQKTAMQNNTSKPRLD